MNPSTASVTPSTANAAARPMSSGPSLGERTARLFRVSLSQGRLHPLYMPMLSYQTAKLGSAA